MNPKEAREIIEIPLTQGKFAIIDQRYSHLTKFKWHYGCKGYACRTFRNESNWKKTKRMYLHHAVVGQPINGLQVDHINGDTLDCRESNLRIVTLRENNLNKKCHRTGNKTSRFPGVHWHKNNNRWIAKIRTGGKQKQIGSFINEVDAANAYIEILKLLDEGK